MAEGTKSIEQQIAAKEAELARLKDKQRKLENGQKIILGGLLLDEMRSNEKTRAWILKAVSEKVTREADKKRLAPLLAELRGMSSSGAAESTKEDEAGSPAANVTASPYTRS